MKRGFIPIACNKYGWIAWQGVPVKDLWMWNGRFTDGKDGKKIRQTIRVSTVKDAAMRCWRDGWVPVKPVDGDFLRLMEDALRTHPGLKRQGVKFPEGEFLKPCHDIPAEKTEG